MDHHEKLTRFRQLLAERQLDGWLVPRSDAHQNENPPAHDERLAWLTGFSGSAGIAIVLLDRAAIFVDGRYTLQVREQVDSGLFEPRSLTEPPAAWLAANADAGARIGYDPWLHSAQAIEVFRKHLAGKSVTLQAVDDNPIDRAWDDQPPPPVAPIVPHDRQYAGQDSAAKRLAIAADLVRDGVDAAILTNAESLAWLLNVRGRDVPRAPLPLSFGIVDRDGAVNWYVDDRKLTPALAGHLGNAVTIRPVEALLGDIDALGARGAKIGYDPAGTPALLVDRVTASGGRPHEQRDPCALPRARKNTVEQDGARAAHRRDGVAMVRFLAWLEHTAPLGGLSEIAASDRLAALRAEGEHFRDLSFDSISAAGPHAAIPHYHATAASDRLIARGDIYLIDSGGQYLDGTTDITRTVIIGGVATPEQRDRFTRVLQGHIALARQVFPVGITGERLDTLARAALWQGGFDYDHGTGHGVGSYLSVHEGPARISGTATGVALAAGMILSNEPGYYKPGAYGIRIENLVLVRPVTLDGAEHPMLGFENLTLCPLDRGLIDTARLAADEIAWIDAYHARVGQTLTGLLHDPDDQRWLAAATRPL